MSKLELLERLELLEHLELFAKTVEVGLKSTIDKSTRC